jgi:pimeloyl-ACP methyl ester carboxylesterase
MKKIKWFVLSVAFVMIIYVIGPHPKSAVYSLSLPSIPPADSLVSFVQEFESSHQIKPGNEAKILWANDSLHQKTEYAIVYLHGFSASHEEGNPVHRNISKFFGSNLYLARLSQHGIDTSEQLLNLTAENYWETAKQALSIGKQLGDKVILMGTSTGATQAIQLAAAYPNDVAAIILYCISRV